MAPSGWAARWCWRPGPCPRTPPRGAARHRVFPPTSAAISTCCCRRCTGRSSAPAAAQRERGAGRQRRNDTGHAGAAHQRPADHRRRGAGCGRQAGYRQPENRNHPRPQARRRSRCLPATARPRWPKADLQLQKTLEGRWVLDGVVNQLSHPGALVDTAGISGRGTLDQTSGFALKGGLQQASAVSSPAIRRWPRPPATKSALKGLSAPMGPARCTSRTWSCAAAITRPRAMWPSTGWKRAESHRRPDGGRCGSGPVFRSGGPSAGRRGAGRGQGIFHPADRRV